MESVKEYVYSLSDEGPFTGQVFLTREDALEAGTEEYLDNHHFPPDNPVGCFTIFTGVQRKLRFSELFPHWGQVSDWLGDRAFDNAGEVSFEWPGPLPENAIIELNKLLDDWATRHRLQPTFFAVDDMKDHEVCPVA